MTSPERLHTIPCTGYKYTDIRHHPVFRCLTWKCPFSKLGYVDTPPQSQGTTELIDPQSGELSSPIFVSIISCIADKFDVLPQITQVGENFNCTIKSSSDIAST